MRRVCAGLTALTFVLALGAPAFAKSETVKGQIVDQSCYNREKTNTGVDHKMPRGDVKDCAIACAKMGRPMALLTSEGKVYELTGGLAAENNAKIVPHVAHTVEVTGEVTDKDGKMSIASDSLKMISK